MQFCQNWLFYLSPSRGRSGAGPGLVRGWSGVGPASVQRLMLGLSRELQKLKLSSNFRVWDLKTALLNTFLTKIAQGSAPEPRALASSIRPWALPTWRVKPKCHFVGSFVFFFSLFHSVCFQL